MKDTASAVSLQLRLVLFGKLSAVPGAVRIVTSLFVAVCLPRQALGLEDSLRSAAPARAGRAGSRCVQGAVVAVTSLTRSVSFLRGSSTNWNLAGMPPRAIRARCGAFRYCPDPLGIVPAEQFDKLEFI